MWAGSPPPGHTPGGSRRSQCPDPESQGLSVQHWATHRFSHTHRPLASERSRERHSRNKCAQQLTPGGISAAPRCWVQGLISFLERKQPGFGTKWPSWLSLK